MSQEKEQSALLTEFYNIVLAHINGVERGDIHWDAGLCWNLQHWAMKKTHRNDITVKCVLQEMEQQFEDAGLNRMFPFNRSEAAFCNEQRAEALYDNPARIQWVKDHAQM